LTFDISRFLFWYKETHDVIILRINTPGSTGCPGKWPLKIGWSESSRILNPGRRSPSLSMVCMEKKVLISPIIYISIL
ncbi:MAG: hypothetical protein WAS28_13000, partial [Saprospiraceae bacterium]